MSLFRSVFLTLSASERLRAIAEQSAVAGRISRRFVAGMQLADALEATRVANRDGISVTLDALGESVTNEAHARASADAYRRMLEAIHAERLDANVSLKLTQMGMDLGVEFAEEVVRGLCEQAAATGNFVRVDMEGSAYTADTLAMVRRLHALPGLSNAVGVVVQAYLRQTPADAAALDAEGIRLRLCKGAYREPETVALPLKADVDRQYVAVAERLVASQVFHGLATHDERIIAHIKRFVDEQGIDRASFEFQMLHGIRRDLQKKLVQQGYRVRVYIPYGTEWYPYFMRRLAERPANALFLARNLLK